MDDRYPSLRDMARLATEDFSRIESLDQVRPPYPARGTPNWWALRLRYEELLNRKITDLRKSSGIAIDPPSDPFADPVFIRALNSAYDVGRPAEYPAEAPVCGLNLAGAKAA